jgi:rubrerythrin
MDRTLTSVEVLGLAIRSEEDAAKFYGHISRMIENNLVRVKYEQLAKEETGHRKMLVTLYKEMTGTEESPERVPGEPETAEGDAIPDDIADSLEGLLRLAVKREKNAHEFYREAAAKAKDLSGRRILEYLADVEKGHQAMLEKEVEAYHRDKEWYRGQQYPAMTHVGA